jgi:hypothetical protein
VHIKISLMQIKGMTALLEGGPGAGKRAAADAAGESASGGGQAGLLQTVDSKRSAGAVSVSSTNAMSGAAVVNMQGLYVC